MATQKINWFKRNGISLTTLIIVLGILVNLASWKEGVDKDIVVLYNHKNDKIVHMPLDEKLKIFVTKPEFKGMENMLEAINSKVDLLLEKELNGN